MLESARNTPANKPPNKSNKPTTKTAPKKGGLKSSLRQRLFGRANPPNSAQQSIPYHEMFRDGICRVTDKLYTKTITFFDINYQLGATRSHTNTTPLIKSLWANRPCSAKNEGLSVIHGSNNLCSDEWNDGVTP